MMAGRRALVAALALGAVRPAVAREVKAEQLRYDRSPAGDGLQIDTVWEEPDGTRRALRFRLPGAAMAEEARRIVPPSADARQRAGLAAAQAVADRAPPGVRLHIRPIPNGLNVSADGPAGMDLQRPMQAAMQAYDQATSAAIRDAGYRFVNAGLFEPDYARMVAEQAQLLRVSCADIAAQTAGLAPRERVQLLNAFLQSLPYDILRARDAIPMRTPAGVLGDDRGDCDSKSVTLATLLSASDPGLAVAMITGENHAFLGVGLGVAPGDTAFRVGGQSFVAVEPVGPGWFPTGTVSELSRRILGSGVAHSLVLRG